MRQALPKLAQKILSLEGVSYLEKEVDQWVCYTKPGFWFPDMECGTCIEYNLKDLWSTAKRVQKAPLSYLVYTYGASEAESLLGAS
jgi:hypothetical protein